MLRFPGFVDEWVKKRIGDVGVVVTGSTPPTNKPEYYAGDLPFVTPVDLTNNRHVISTANTVSALGFQKGRRIPANSIVFVCIGSTIGKIGQLIQDSITNQQINSVVVNELQWFDFVYSLLEYHSSYIIRLAAKQAVPQINKSVFEKYNVTIPLYQEQKKIATFLSAVDARIGLLKKKKEQLEAYKRGAMQQIFSRHVRFKDSKGKEYPTWDKLKLGSILIEKVERNNDSKHYKVLSSTAKGLFYQEEYFNNIIASNDLSSYKVLRYGQLVFSPQNLWLGNININLKYEAGIVSPSYKIFEFNKKYTSPQFCKYLLVTPRMVYEYVLSSEQGASIVRRNLNMDLFNTIDVFMPSLAEQQKIADFLSGIDKKIELCGKQIADTERFKKGLLQQMFV